MPRERAPGRPCGPECVPTSSGRAGPRSPEGFAAAGESREAAFGPAARPSPPSRPPRRCSLSSPGHPCLVSAPQGGTARFAPFPGRVSGARGRRERTPGHLKRQAGRRVEAGARRGSGFAHLPSAPLVPAPALGPSSPLCRAPQRPLRAARRPRGSELLSPTTDVALFPRPAQSPSLHPPASAGTRLWLWHVPSRCSVSVR